MKFSLTDLPLLLGAVHGVFLALIISTRKDAARPTNYLFAFIVLLTSWQLFAFSIRYSGNLAYLPHTLWTGYPFSFLVGPLFFLYTRFVFSDKKRFCWHDILHFLPFVWELYFSRWFYLLDGKSKIELYLRIQEGPQEVSPEMLIVVLKITVVSVVYFTLSYLTLRKCKRALAEQTSDNTITRNIDHVQFLARLFVTIVVGYCTLTLCFYTMGSFPFEIDYFWLLGKSLIIHIVGYLAINHPSSIFFTDVTEGPVEESQFHTNESSQASAEKYAKSGLSKVQIDEYYKRLLVCIEKEAPHLNCDINLAELAKLLGISSNHLSQVINQRAKQNFNDFINLHRVEYAKKLFENPKYDSKHNVIEIAFKAGFNSKASFNRVFKKHTGQTPTDFRNEVRKYREIQYAS